MSKIVIADLSDPPVDLGVNAVRAALDRRPRRLAFAGRAGAGKTTLCQAISGLDRRYPVINHADPIKVEVLDWVIMALTNELEDEVQAWECFCEFLGLDAVIARVDLAYVLEPLFAACWELVIAARQQGWVIAPFIGLGAEERLADRIAFVDDRKAIFRTALQRYGQAIKEIEADPTYWAKRTIDRTLAYPICLNGDTRFREEAEVLAGCGWLIVYLFIDDATQQRRLPYLTEEHRQHPSEQGIRAADCHWVIDARQSLGNILVDLSELLAR